jgi:hypothetical protein
MLCFNAMWQMKRKWGSPGYANSFSWKGTKIEGVTTNPQECV